MTARPAPRSIAGMRHPAAPVLGLLAALAACAGAPPPAGPDFTVPCFTADDARVGQAGFVAATHRENRDVDGVRYTLMAFAVGDKLTLGAMVKGAFRGEVRWQVGERTLHVPFDAAAPAAASQVVVAGDAAAPPLQAQGAQFRGTAWTNIELPAAWLPAGAPLALVFAPAQGTPVALPPAGAFAARPAPAPPAAAKNP